MRTTLDTTCRLGFGVDLGCLSPGLPKLPFSVSFENTNAASFRRFVDPLWRVKRILQVGREKLLKESLKVMDEFTYNIIKTRKAETSASTQLTGNHKVYCLHHTFKYVYGGLLLGYCYISHNCRPASDISICICCSTSGQICHECITRSKPNLLLEA